ncbi:fimbrial chaperone protein [Pseudomonas delhiensis]|uniref:Fimbrial chaperone protein n=1 Tax=Pseudomonas delhiensis TaxID=366289 RepID=A0A239IXW7_9PSED|nr:molecular chaperone [Pseudomonas delhiensis]SDK12703.1 fimbrial chaperone protein [Pseudomonas delhiensis]SNS98365.1 fimbrial chaperone protein [Pseudomonas delhiensis]
MPFALLLILLVLLPAAARADSSILIWPIDPRLEHDQRASALWLENRGARSALLQVRIFAWSQRDGEEHYQAQREVVGSPPMVRVEPGARQLVRLTRLAPSAAGTEHAYRILIDEVPTPQDEAQGPEGSGIRFQMRYSVPLFLAGPGLPAGAGHPALGWRQVEAGGKAYLEISNAGPRHVRLTRVAFERGGASLAMDEGLLGYVLPGSRMRWPLPRPLAGGERLWAEVNGERGEIAAVPR